MEEVEPEGSPILRRARVQLSDGGKRQGERVHDFGCPTRSTSATASTTSANDSRAGLAREEECQVSGGPGRPRRARGGRCLGARCGAEGGAPVPPQQSSQKTVWSEMDNLARAKNKPCNNDQLGSDLVGLAPSHMSSVVKNKAQCDWSDHIMLLKSSVMKDSNLHLPLF
ncbi:hypothetical protein CEXT_605651 [Caerostris extrusa]|uniref:Uncharacterized protein n=1 Tax=Caerostris extrusa TaxID=172846 RepID=A0AAV4Y2C3_CAEEX|nr:hypothetical protein CEXT_605651 [Caerostris extrusa]